MLAEGDLAELEGVGHRATAKIREQETKLGRTGCLLARLRPRVGDCGRGAEHPTAGARRRGLVRSHDMHYPSAECVRCDAVDGEAAQVEQTRGVRYQILLSMGNSRTLKQARGLTLIRNCL